jgi:glycosyltransferase involved in cell wall biosynthesis
MADITQAQTTRPLRVVHMVATKDGAPWVIAFLRAQQRLGHDVAAIIPSLDGTIAPILARDGIPCHAAPMYLTSAPRTIPMIWRLVRLMRRLRPDVIHSHIFPTFIFSRIAAWIADAPLHFSMNAGPYTMESDVCRPLEVGTASFDTRSIVSCELVREMYQKAGVPAEQIELIYYAVEHRRYDPAITDGARIRRELGLAPDQPTIGFVAYFYPPTSNSTVVPRHLEGRGVKGHDILLHAVPLVREVFPTAKFLLVGKGWGPQGEAYERELHALADTLGVSDSVIFTGERSDVPDVLASLDVSVHCSRTENLGGTLESLLMARPMVVTRVGGMVDTVRDGETGLVVPPDDPPAMAAAIVRLLRDRALAERLGANGRRLMLERFSLDRAVSDFESLYQRSAAAISTGTVPPRDRRYRWMPMLARTLVLPFRVWAPMQESSRVLHGNASLARRVYLKARHYAARVRHKVIGPRQRLHEGTHP